MKNAAQYQPPVRSIVLPIRNSVRALIVRKDRVLLLRKRSRNGQQRYAMPGGGQDRGETLHESLLRECREEIAAKVDIIGMAHVANAFKPLDAKLVNYRQQVEFIFFVMCPKATGLVRESSPTRIRSALSGSAWTAWIRSTCDHRVWRN